MNTVSVKSITVPKKLRSGRIVNAPKNDNTKSELMNQIAALSERLKKLEPQ